MFDAPSPSQTDFPDEEGAAVPLRMTCRGHEPSLASLLGKVRDEGFDVICARHAQPVFCHFSFHDCFPSSSASHSKITTRGVYKLR
jgi:hypothetical protein